MMLVQEAGECLVLEEDERPMRSAIEALSAAHRLSDPHTFGHETRVGWIGGAVAEALGLDAHRVEGIRIAGLMHDIGKIAVPAQILAKPGPLTRAEFALIRKHPQHGHEILKGIPFPWPVAQVALQHHERLDGSGYPRGLEGDEILFEARIVAVADVVEAMASHRSYRPALGIDKALAEIERGRGSIYDPVVVDACLTLFRESDTAVMHSAYALERQDFLEECPLPGPSDSIPPKSSAFPKSARP